MTWMEGRKKEGRKQKSDGRILHFITSQLHRLQTRVAEHYVHSHDVKGIEWD